ncbi:MAG: bifunctional diaminohydroxyphosphoribosylaminopyrimidine deaminase/5-amino-6-(5-phosphoribosylamino)uracil reductase RibD [Planctomycetota bacterium]
MCDKDERCYMLEALRGASEGRGRVEPNPMVGAVVVRDGEVLGKGAHLEYGGPHAEVNCLRDVRSRGNCPDGAVMYVTLEPCAHEGKTPACAFQLVDAGLKRVVVAMGDPLWKRHADRQKLPAKAKRGLDILARAGIRTEVGLCANEAMMQNAAFFKRICTGQPLVIAKWAMTADGKIATRTGSSQWISGDQSRRRVHQLRGRMDAVIVGGGTAAVDDPRLTCRDAAARREATRVVICGRRAPAPDSRLIETLDEAPVILAHEQGAVPEGLAEAVKCGCEPLSIPSDGGERTGVDCAALLDELGDREMSNVLVEGGGEILGSLFDADLVDRNWVFVAPRVIGGREAIHAVGGTGVQTVDRGKPMLGKTTLGENRGIPGKPETRVCLSGDDILIKGWVSDPRHYCQPDTGSE